MNVSAVRVHPARPHMSSAGVPSVVVDQAELLSAGLGQLHMIECENDGESLVMPPHCRQ